MPNGEVDTSEIVSEIIRAGKVNIFPIMQTLTGNPRYFEDILCPKDCWKPNGALEGIWCRRFTIFSKWKVGYQRTTS